jgi:hypothetical protein
MAAWAYALLGRSSSAYFTLCCLTCNNSFREDGKGYYNTQTHFSPHKHIHNRTHTNTHTHKQTCSSANNESDQLAEIGQKSAALEADLRRTKRAELKLQALLFR